MTHGGPGLPRRCLSYPVQQGILWFNWGMASALGVILIFVVAIVGILGLALFRHYGLSL